LYIKAIGGINIANLQIAENPECKNKTYLPFDFVLEENKIIIELDGIQHFEQITPIILEKISIIINF
jgi:hypothetical protein